MAAAARDQALEELDKSLSTPEESFRQAWDEVRRGETRPLSEIWDGMDSD